MPAAPIRSSDRDEYNRLLRRSPVLGGLRSIGETIGGFFDPIPAFTQPVGPAPQGTISDRTRPISGVPTIEGFGAAPSVQRTTAPAPLERPVLDLAAALEGVPGPVGAPAFDPNTGLDQIAAAQREAAASLAELDMLFEQRKAMLREEYQLTETPEERANIQQLLAMIEAQRNAGTKVIERVYGKAIADSAARAEATRASGLEAEQRTAETFQDVAGETTELFEGLADTFGGAMGVGGETLSPDAEEIVADLIRQGAAEAAFDRRMFDLTAGDIEVLGEAMRPEMGAQIGALQRDAMGLSTQAQFEHDQAINQRIAQERANLALAQQQLASQFDARRFGLEDQQIALGAQAADIYAANQRHASSLAAQAANAGLSPAQDLTLRQAELEYESQLRSYEQEQMLMGLVGLGATPEQATFANAIGLGQDLGRNLLAPPTLPPELLESLVRPI